MITFDAVTRAVADLDSLKDSFEDKSAAQYLKILHVIASLQAVQAESEELFMNDDTKQ
jgi:hypothetical protein